MLKLDPDIRRTWLFGPGADDAVHRAMLASGADALIVDLEDFTPPNRRDEARSALNPYVQGCRKRGCIAAVRINQLEGCGKVDLAAAMMTRPDVIVYPLAEQVAQMHALEAAISDWEAKLDVDRLYRDRTGVRNGSRCCGCASHSFREPTHSMRASSQ